MPFGVNFATEVANAVPSMAALVVRHEGSGLPDTDRVTVTEENVEGIPCARIVAHGRGGHASMPALRSLKSKAANGPILYRSRAREPSPDRLRRAGSEPDRAQAVR